MSSLHIAFNFTDYTIRLRIAGIIAALVVVTCLAAFELYPKFSRTQRAMISVVLAASIVLLGYVLFGLGNK